MLIFSLNTSVLAIFAQEKIVEQSVINEGNDVNLVGNTATVGNIVKGVNGSPISIQNGNDYTYDSNTNEITFNNVTQTGDKSYSFNQQVRVGNTSTTFSGTVTQNVVDRVIDIPDPNFKAVLNRCINWGSGDTFSGKYDNNDIKLSQLKNLTEINRCNVGNISNLEGIQYCENLTLIDLFDENISDISLLRGLTKLETIQLPNNKINDISALSGLTKLKVLCLSNNNIKDLSSISGLINLTSLELDNNHIKDLSPLSSLTKITNSTIKNQTITENEVLSVGSNATVKNVVKNVDGSFINISNGNNYTYDNNTHEVTFTGITQTEDRSYSFNTSVHIGNNIPTFSGTVTQNVVYDQIIEIPDPNLKACLNKKIHNVTSNQFDTEDITLSKLTGLTDTLDATRQDIYDLEGLQYCTNLSALILANNDIESLEPLRNLTNLKQINIHWNKIRDIEPLNGLTNLNHLNIRGNKISDISALEKLTNLNFLDISANKISDISSLSGMVNLTQLNIGIHTDPSDIVENNVSDLTPLQNLNSLKILDITRNNVVDISPLTGLSNLKNLYLDENSIVDLTPLDNFSATNLNISMENQRVTLGKTTIDDGIGEVENPLKLPKFSSVEPTFSISPNGNISKNGDKFELSDLSEANNNFVINESTTINNTGKMSGNYSVNINMPVEHISTIKVDLPTSMIFDVVTNTKDPKTNALKPTFATAEYTINNRGKKEINIVPSYSVIEKGGVTLVESINDKDIVKDNDVKIAVKLKDLSTNQNIMSVVDKAKGSSFTIAGTSNTKLTFEAGANGMEDAKKEQLSDTKTTIGEITFTISN